MQPRVEALERRDTPSTTVGRGMVVVTGTPRDDVVSVQAEPAADRLTVVFNGNVTISRLSSVSTVVADLGEGDDYFGYSGPARSRGDGGLRLVVSLGAGSDQFLASTGCAQAVVFGDAGSDHLDAWPGYRGVLTALGGSGNDTVTGGLGEDYLDGGGGNDAVDGRGGDDLLVGGVGRDTVWAASGADTVDAGAGNDLVYALASTAVVPGGAGDRVVIL